MRHHVLSTVLGAALAALFPFMAQGQSRNIAPLPDGDGRETVQAVCTACHNANQIT